MGMGGSMPYGKIEITNFLRERIPFGSTILDIGAGCGTYHYYMGCGYVWEAVEIWPESVAALKEWYNQIYEMDIRDFKYPKHYDLIILGDVLEHLNVEDAQLVLQQAKEHADRVMVGVPFLYEQDEMYGNKAEEHLQPDLTHEIFKQRYPGMELIIGRYDLYGYYYWEKDKV